jgi:hypothetical protein
MVGSSAEQTLPSDCPHCGTGLYRGSARCRACGSLRPEFEPHAAVVSEMIGCCCASGAESDVKLPTGEYVWAPYFLDMIADGWLDVNYAFTSKCPWPRAGS